MFRKQPKIKMKNLFYTSDNVNKFFELFSTISTKWPLFKLMFENEVLVMILNNHYAFRDL